MAEQSSRAMSMAQFSSQYGVGRTKVFELVATGELVTVTVGRRRLVPVDSAEAWLATKIAEAQPA